MEDNLGSFFNDKLLEKFWKLANMNILYKVDPDSAKNEPRTFRKSGPYIKIHCVS